MIFEPDHPMYRWIEVDAHSGLRIGAEGQSVIDKRQPGSDRGPPAKGTGDMRVAHVGQRRFGAKRPVACDETTVVGERHALVAAPSKWQPERGQPPFVAIGEVSAVLLLRIHRAVPIAKCAALAHAGHRRLPPPLVTLRRACCYRTSRCSD